MNIPEPINADATLLALQFAAASNNSAELDRLNTAWTAATPSRQLGAIALAALRISAINVIEPMLQQLDQGDAYRQHLADARDNAETSP